MPKKLKVHNPDNLETIDFHELEPFQGDLKEIDEEAIEKLVRSIKDHGFIVPAFVWQNEGNYYAMDGHQRKKALKRLETEGFEIPPIPIVNVQADNRKDAAKKLLQINSKYGKINPDTTFLEDMDIDPLYLEDVEIPELDLNMPDTEDEDQGEYEDDNEDNDKLQRVKCPDCGYEWKLPASE